MPLTPRERALLAIDHREADRVPIFFDATPGALRALYAYFGVSDTMALFQVMDIDGFSMFAEDTYVAPDYIGPELFSLEDGTRADCFGIICQRHEPLAFARTIADLDRYRWPCADWFDYRRVKERCLANKGKGMITSGGEGGCGICHAINLRGFENAVCDPLDDPHFTLAYLERMTDFFVEWNERWLSAAEGEIDLFRCGDDMGNNLTMHCSPEIWRTFYKPQLRRVFEVAKRHGCKISFHCCGCCAPVLPDLIEIGIDIWDPTPPTVAGNDHAFLKREYGRDITFVGGIDHPNVLAHGTPREIDEEVRRRIELLAPGGGYIVGPAQGLTDDIPLANILACYEAIHRHGRY